MGLMDKCGSIKFWYNFGVDSCYKYLDIYEDTHARSEIWRWPRDVSTFAAKQCAFLTFAQHRQ
jgi:hypothetical protein